MSNETDAILDLENRRLLAMKESNPDALADLLEEDHVHVMANGAVTDKRGAVESVRNIPREVEPRTPQVRVYGDVAILTGPQINHERINGEVVIVKLFVTQVVRRTNGVWKFVSMHAVRLPA
jgi:hypothetical protein